MNRWHKDPEGSSVAHTSAVATEKAASVGRGRWRLFLLILAVLLALGVALLAVRGSGGGSRIAQLQDQLSRAVASGADHFNFGATGFEWDKMYVFGPYTSQKDVESLIGISWPEFKQTTVKSSDSVCLVLFVRDSEVVGWYEQPRTIDLSWLTKGEPYMRSDAVFRIDRTAQPPALAERTSRDE